MSSAPPGPADGARTVEATAVSRVVRPGRRRDTSAAARRVPTRGAAVRRWLAPLVVAELALVAVLAAGVGVRPWGATQVVVTVVAALAVLLTWVRRRGRALDRWVARGIAFRLRGRRPARGGDVDANTLDALDPALGGLGLPGFTVRAHVDRAGNRAGVALVDPSLTGVVRVAAGADPDPARLLRAVRAAFDRTDIPLAAASLVVWSVPGPARDSVLRVHWLAVRYLPAAAPAAAAARGGGMTGAVRTTAMAALGLARDLTEAGVPAEPLGVRGLRGDIGVAVGLDPTVLTGAERAPEPTSGWRSWSAGSVHQQTVRPARHGPLETHADLLRAYAPGSAFTCVAATVRRDLYGTVSEEVLVRVGVSVRAGRDDPRTALDEATAKLGVPVVPLSGEQDRGVRATLPLAL